MSYIVSITRNNVPKNDKQAWQYLEELSKNDSGNSATDFVELIKKFTATYPCICDLPDDQVDDGVWSDGPLVNNAGENITTLGVVFSQVENVTPFLIEISNQLGFVVFDSQTGIISRPLNSSPDKQTHKKGFWKTLFGG